MSDTPANPEREIRYEYSAELAGALEEVGGSLLVSTYQAGKVAVISASGGQVSIRLHNFERPMGMAVSEDRDRLAVATKEQVWLLRNAAAIAPQIEPAGQHDACYLTRQSYFTGEIQSHEMAWSGDTLYVVNTLFSCLAQVDAGYSFVPVWKPKFISQLAAEDRCHLNGLAMAGGKPKYATAMAESDEAEGWRPDKANTGCLIDIEADETIARGFAMPHSPRFFGGFVWLLDSGRGSLLRVDPKTGKWETAARFPGFTRGLWIQGSLAFVGLSKIREKSTFGGVPIAEKSGLLKCGVGVVNLHSGELAGQFEFTTGVDEIFDVTVISGVQHPVMRGPFASQEGESAIWLAPPLAKSPSLF